MGKSIEVTRQEHTPSDLRRLAGKTEDGGQVRRLLGVALVLEGRARGEAASASGMDRQILCDWVHRYNAAGVAGLATGTRPGRPPSLNEAQMAELKELVIKGPDPELHKVVRWRCVDLCEEIAHRYSVKVTKGTMGKWLRKLKLTRLQPRPHHPKKVAEAQETFKKTLPAWSRMRCLAQPPARRSRSGFKMKPAWDRRDGCRISGRRSAHGPPR
jgi:transposase